MPGWGAASNLRGVVQAFPGIKIGHSRKPTGYQSAASLAKLILKPKSEPQFFLKG